MFFTKYAPVLGALIASTQASPAPLMASDKSLVSRAPATSSFDLGKTYAHATLFDGLAPPAQGDLADVNLFLGLPNAVLTGDVVVELNPNFVTDPTVIIHLDGVKAYIELDVKADAKVFAATELVTSPKLSIDVPGLLDVKAGLALALDLVVSLDAAIDLSAGFYVNFPQGSFIEVNVLTSKVVDHMLDNLLAKTLPLTLGVDVNLDADVTLEVGLRLRTEIGLDAHVTPLGLPLLKAGAEVAVWINLFDYTSIIIGNPHHAKPPACSIAVTEAFALDVGIIVDLDVDVLHILDLDLAPTVSLTLASAPLATVCIGGGSGSSSSVSTVFATTTSTSTAAISTHASASSTGKGASSGSGASSTGKGASSTGKGASSGSGASSTGKGASSGSGASSTGKGASSTGKGASSGSGASHSTTTVSGTSTVTFIESGATTITSTDNGASSSYTKTIVSQSAQTVTAIISRGTSGNGGASSGSGSGASAGNGGASTGNVGPISSATVKGPNGLITSTMTETQTLTITSCAASVVNCPASFTQKIVTEVIVTKTTVCPVAGASSAPYWAGNGTASATGAATIPTSATFYNTVTFTTYPASSAPANTFTAPASWSAVPGTVTLTGAAPATMAPTGAAASESVLITAQPSASKPASGYPSSFPVTAGAAGLSATHASALLAVVAGLMLAL
ncbi:hypothetical protein SEPCBS119000_005111 [Sporothrix epigloea]|uniref:Uncharacterized protein n=1 Tax=Sporothrix epigloea TaxID=1892477 RepID=A0ABP0DXN3_9PEZI